MKTMNILCALLCAMLLTVLPATAQNTNDDKNKAIIEANNGSQELNTDDIQVIRFDGGKVTVVHSEGETTFDRTLRSLSFQRPNPGTLRLTATTSIATEDSGNRAQAIDGDGNLKSTWESGDVVYVYADENTTTSIGTLTPKTYGNKTATLTGNITATNLSEGQTLYFSTKDRATLDLSSQDGTVGSLFYFTATGTITINGGNASVSDLDFTRPIAVVKFMLKDKGTNDLSATSLTVNDGTNNYTVTPASATNVLYVGIPATGTVNLSTTVGGISYFYNKTGAGLLANMYYAITVKMNRGIVNLGNITGDVTLYNGDVVTGTFKEYYHPHKISIADGATITLNGVDINSSGYSSPDYAGLTCLGDATIILKDGTTNTVKGFDTDYPGIFIPSGHTLTIQGTGALNASSNEYSSAAGIGGGDEIPCGNIIINSGTITATCDGYYSAGIGGGHHSSCGNITINGGTVTATGGIGATGIGGGDQSTCGDITINGGTVTATGGDDGSGGAGIGSGRNYGSSCGDITINGGTITATGGQDAAGIGSSGFYSSCGDITISRGTVEATGGRDAVGIGSGGGFDASCGAITIENTVTRVTASNGSEYQESIGKGRYGDACGTVTIGGTVYWDGSNYQNDGETYLSTRPLVYAPAPTVPTGAIDGKFTINDSGDKVYFSQGNLMYSDGTWSFHTNQYDMCFTSTGDVVDQYDEYGTFDLFGYGTSGHDYDPYMTNPDDNDYYSESIAGTEYDWGINAISNGGNTANSGWRTLTRDEWEYLINDRDTESYVRYAKAIVNGVEGLILFPDDWSTSYYTIINYNEFYEVNYSANVISSSDWTNSLEAHGAVFLPVSFYRNEGTICGINGTLSNYWSSTYNPYERNAYCLTLIEDKERDVNQLSAFGTAPTHLGAFVRLVKDAE